jgi:hypothetical protein
MPVKVFIICSVERLFAHEDDATYAFGLNLSVGTDGSGPAPDKILRPWTWAAVDSVMCGSDVSGGQPTFKARSIFPLTWRGQSLLGKRSEDGYKSLVSEIEGLAPNADYQCSVPDGPQTVPMKSDPTQSPKSVWPALLADLSLRPAPVPHVLGLAFFIKVPKDANVTTIWLAPILPAGVLGNTNPIPPVASLPAPGNVADWEYDPNLI